MNPSEAERIDVDLFTDGGADPNPGKGAWAIMLCAKGKYKEFSQAYRLTTNNRMELLAVISGLEKLKQKCRVTVHSDSQYVVNGIEKGWALSWKEKNWIKKGEPVPNADLWSRLLELVEQHEVTFNWVRGHNGHPENERCDQMATEAIQTQEGIEDEGYRAENQVLSDSGLNSSAQNGAKGKVLKEGDPCRNCQTPVVKHIPAKRNFHPGQSYYFEYIFMCPKCRSQFNTEEAKREIVQSPGLFGDGIA